MIYICRPFRAEIYDNRFTRLTAAEVREQSGCDLAINGGYFGGTLEPYGNIRINGRWLHRESWDIEGFTWGAGELPEMSLTRFSGKDSVYSCLPVISNGQIIAVNNADKEIGGRRGRSGWGCKANGDFVFLCTSDGDGAMTLSGARDELLAAGCVSAVLNDGGASCQMSCPDGDIAGERIVSNFICVWFEATKEDDKMQIQEINYKWAYMPGNRKTTTHLILHHAAFDGTAEAIHAYHKSLGWAGIAYHYYVRKDGTVCRGRPETWTGGHTTNWNWCALGICFEGNFETEIMSEAQKKAGRELVADIVKRYPGIQIGKHKDFQATACPGKNFPFDYIVSGPSDEPIDTDAEAGGGASAWAAESCQKAIDKGIFLGDGKGNYNWTEPLTREAFCAVMDRLGLL